MVAHANRPLSGTGSSERLRQKDGQHCVPTIVAVSYRPTATYLVVRICRLGHEAVLLRITHGGQKARHVVGVVTLTGGRCVHYGRGLARRMTTTSIPPPA